MPDMPPPVTASPHRRIVFRLAPALLLGLGALGYAHHLATTAQPTTVVAAGFVTHGGSATMSQPAPKRVGYDPRVTAPDSTRALEATLPRPAADQPEPTAPGRPVDPQKGGLVDVEPIDRAVPGTKPLGQVHVDPMPPGVTLASPTDTGSLYARSGAVQLAADQLSAASAVPPGTPLITSLTEHVAPSCSGTGSDGPRVQALYVHEQSTPSRYSQVLGVLRNEVANVDDTFAVSSHKTGGDLRVRWVHDAGCLPVIPDVTVPDGSLGPDFGATITALENAGFKSSNRKYLAFADANQMCGIGTYYDNASTTGNPNDGYAASYSRIDVGCWSTGESVAAHELTHNLGGVLSSAPHHTYYGHCYDEWDLMCYDDGSRIAMQTVCAKDKAQLLDCRNDDYFNTHPAAGSYLASHWNTASSSFLDAIPVAPPTVSAQASTSSAETGDRVTLTATSDTSVGYHWRLSNSGCALAGATSSTATMTCVSTVSGPVTATVTVTAVSTGATNTASVTVAVSKAAAPTAQPAAPTQATAGTTFRVSVTPTGKAPFAYRWSLTGPCALSSPTVAAPSVVCAAAGDAAVAVEVTQADGQTVTARAPVPVVAPAAGALPSGSSWTTLSRASGPPVRLSATLRDAASGIPLVELPVRLEVRWRGTDGYLPVVAGLVTDRAGRVTAAVPDTARAGWFRLAYAGGSAYAPSVSSPQYAKVRTRLWLGARPRHHLVLGRLTTADGTAVARAELVLQRRKAGSSRWGVVTRTRTDAAGRGRVRVRAHQKTYFRWVYRGEVVHLDSRSVRVTLRR